MKALQSLADCDWQHEGLRMALSRARTFDPPAFTARTGQLVTPDQTSGAQAEALSILWSEAAASQSFCLCCCSTKAMVSLPNQSYGGDSSQGTPTASRMLIGPLSCMNCRPSLLLTSMVPAKPRALIPTEPTFSWRLGTNSMCSLVKIRL